MSRRRIPPPIRPAVEANAAWAAAAPLRRANAEAQPPPLPRVTGDQLSQLEHDYEENYGPGEFAILRQNPLAKSAIGRLEERQRAEEERRRAEEEERQRAEERGKALYEQHKQQGQAIVQAASNRQAQQQLLQDEERRRKSMKSMDWYGMDNFARQGGGRRKSKKKKNIKKKTKSYRRSKSLRRSKSFRKNKY